jgi:hypothetical protein
MLHTGLDEAVKGNGKEPKVPLKLKHSWQSQHVLSMFILFFNVISFVTKLSYCKMYSEVNHCFL